MSDMIPASSEALLSRLIDYAGLYPPAGLPLAEVVERYERYLNSPHAWMLNRLVLPEAKLGDVTPDARWRITLLSDSPVARISSRVESVETKTEHAFPVPVVYRELPLASIRDGFAKVRTGALVSDGIPTSEAVTDFLVEAARRRLPFKATAGLHHPLRAMHPLTYAADSPSANMHGFVNIFAAACFAWHGSERSIVFALINESDPQAFHFEDTRMRWRDRSLPTEQIATARRDFAHSFGSCSFEEPVHDLQQRGWLA